MRKALAKVEQHIADAVAKGARIALRRQAPRARRHVLRADRDHRRDAGDADGARGDLRAGGAAVSLRDRGGCDPHGQRHRVRPGRLLLYARPGALLAGRRGARVRHRRPQHRAHLHRGGPVRRHQGVRHRAARARSTASSTTPSSSTCASGSAERALSARAPRHLRYRGAMRYAQLPRFPPTTAPSASASCWSTPARRQAPEPRAVRALSGALPRRSARRGAAARAVAADAVRRSSCRCGRARVARKYRAIWSQSGSPLRDLSRAAARAS